MTTTTNGGWIEEIPQVEIELMANGNVRLTDKTDFNSDHSVDLHPIHLRLIAERLGLVGAISDTEAHALRTVDKLVRRMQVLLDRIEQLQKWLSDAPDMENADINAEYWFNDATLDLAKEFMREIEESRTVVTPLARREPATKPAAPSGTGPVRLPLFPEDGGAA